MEWGLAILMFPLGVFVGFTTCAVLVVRMEWASRHGRRS